MTPVKTEGVRVVVTDFGMARVKPETAAWFLKHHESKRLKPQTVQRRADASLVAMACFLAEKAWREGEYLEEV